MDNNFDESKFMKNAQGAFIPIENVKAVDKLRDDLVKNLMSKTKEVKKIIEEIIEQCKLN